LPILIATQVILQPPIKIPNNLISVIKFKEKQFMSNKDLFKEAIADAKAVREAALANAKVALEEALAPKLQSMLSAKLQEMDKDNDELEEVDHSSDNYSKDDQWHVKAHERSQADAIGEADGDELEEDFDLSSILAELSDEKEEINEAEEEKSEEEEAPEEEETPEEEEAPEEEESDEDYEAGEGEKITDLTVDELKDIIKDIISSEMGGDEMSADTDDAGGGDEMSVNLGDSEEEIDEEIDLEELLAELDALNENEDKDMKKQPLNEEPISILATALGMAGIAASAFGIEKLNDYLQKNHPKIYAAIQAAGEGIRAGKGLGPMDEGDDDTDEGMYEVKRKDKKKEDEKEMKEALSTIATLRNELNEVNLLNAKLLYVNKIFKAKNLNESQKLKVIAQFDKATTTREAKAIFESMNSAIAKSAKSSIKESLGFASKAAGVAPKKPIVDETMSRWQMLAGITKY
jgi:hypothetical protein